MKWERAVSDIIESMYQNPQHFISGYASNPDNIRKVIISKMKIVPFDIKSILERLHNAVVSHFAPRSDSVA